MTTSNATGAVTRRRVNPAVSALAGVAFTLFGLIGLVLSGGHPAAGRHGVLLFGLFEVNLLHDVVHLVAGAVLIGGAIVSVELARLTNGVLGSGYLALGVAGLLAAGTAANVLALNGADNALHLVVGAALLAVAFGADRPATGRTSPDQASAGHPG